MRHLLSAQPHCVAVCCALAVELAVSPARAVSSAELYTAAAYRYGRFEARVQFAAGDGVVSSFFLWKEGSETPGVFWNELDFEKLWADCRLETNPLYGDPEMSHNQPYDSNDDLCGAFHTYAYEWTPEYIAWFVDGVEIRRETGEVATAFRENADAGMRIHLNVWPGDASFGGNFDPAILPVHQYINWVQYSSYVEGAFQLEWREDFNADTPPSGWSTGNWASPKNLSTHTPVNVTFIDGYAVLSLTADDATGSAGAMPVDDGTSGTGGSRGDGGSAGMNGDGGTAAGSAGTSSSVGGAAGMNDADTPTGAGGAAGSSGAATSPAGGGPAGTGGQATTVPAGGGASAPEAPGTAAPNVPPSSSGSDGPAATDMGMSVPTASSGDSSSPVLMNGSAESKERGSCRVAERRGWSAGAWVLLGFVTALTCRRRLRTPRPAAARRRD